MIVPNDTDLEERLHFIKLIVSKISLLLKAESAFTENECAQSDSLSDRIQYILRSSDEEFQRAILLFLESGSNFLNSTAFEFSTNQEVNGFPAVSPKLSDPEQISNIPPEIILFLDKNAACDINTNTPPEESSAQKKKRRRKTKRLTHKKQKKKTPPSLGAPCQERIGEDATVSPRKLCGSLGENDSNSGVAEFHSPQTQISEKKPADRIPETSMNLPSTEEQKSTVTEGCGKEINEFESHSKVFCGSKETTKKPSKRKSIDSGNPETIPLIAEYFSRVTRTRTGSVPEPQQRYMCPPITPVSKKKPPKQKDKSTPSTPLSSEPAYVVVHDVSPQIDNERKVDPKSFRSPRPRRGQKILFESVSADDEIKTLTGIRRVRPDGEELDLEKKPRKMGIISDGASLVDPKPETHEIVAEKDTVPLCGTMTLPGTTGKVYDPASADDTKEKQDSNDEDLINDETVVSSVVAYLIEESCRNVGAAEEALVKLGKRKDNTSGGIHQDKPEETDPENQSNAVNCLVEETATNGASSLTNLDGKKTVSKQQPSEDATSTHELGGKNSHSITKRKHDEKLESTNSKDKSELEDLSSELETPTADSIFAADASIIIMPLKKKKKSDPGDEDDSSEIENNSVRSVTRPDEPGMKTPMKLNSDAVSLLSYQKMLNRIRQKWATTKTTDDKTFYCARCKQRSTSRGAKKRIEWMNEHVLLHLPRFAKSQLYGCRLCNFLAPEKFHMPMHLSRSHFMTSAVAMAGYKHYVVENVSRFDTELTALAKACFGS